MAIRVVVMLDPLGQGKNMRHLGSLTIANDGTSAGSIRSYDINQHSSSRSDGPPPHTVKKARVENFPSTKVSIWKLVARALKELGHGDV